MAKKNFTIHENQFTLTDLESNLSGLTAFSGYHFTKRNNPFEFQQVLNLLPTGYVRDKINELECVDLIYSGSTQSQFLLTIAAGRNDRYMGTEKLDIDVFNIAPYTGATASYFEHQWHHFRDEDGNRVSFDIHPLIITDETIRKDVTYATFLTGSTAYYSLAEYEKERPEFFDIHLQSFKNIIW